MSEVIFHIRRVLSAEGPNPLDGDFKFSNESRVSSRFCETPDEAMRVYIEGSCAVSSAILFPDTEFELKEIRHEDEVQYEMEDNAVVLRIYASDEGAQNSRYFKTVPVQQQ